MGLEIVALPKLHLKMHFFRYVFRAADFLSNSEPQDLFAVSRKRYLTILSQVSYGLYPAGNIKFRVNNDKAT